MIRYYVQPGGQEDDNDHEEDDMWPRLWGCGAPNAGDIVYNNFGY